MPPKTTLLPEVREFLSKIGTKGGKARARNNSPERLSEIGKMGGRPPKADGKKKGRVKA